MMNIAEAAAVAVRAAKTDLRWRGQTIARMLARQPRHTERAVTRSCARRCTAG